MKILCICDEGNNRSVTLAQVLKYEGHETLSAGGVRNSKETLIMLCDWADLIILTEKSQYHYLTDQYLPKTELLNIGPDNYPRPFNKQLLRIIKMLLDRNQEWFKT